MKKVSKFIVLFTFLTVFFQTTWATDREDGCPLYSGDRLYNELIKKIYADDVLGVEDVLVAKAKQLKAEAKCFGFKYVASYISQELARFVCRTITGRVNFGHFPLSLADSQEAVELLLRAGADISQQHVRDGEVGNSLLDKVCEYSYLQTKFRNYLPFFLSHGAILKEKNYREIVCRGDFRNLLLLIKEGVDLSVCIEDLGRDVSMLEYSNSLLQFPSRRWTQEEQSYYARNSMCWHVGMSFRSVFLREEIFELLSQRASLRPPKLDDRLVNIILRYPELALSNPEGLRGLRYGPADEYVFGEEEIEAIRKAHEENRQRWIDLAKEELGMHKSLIASLRKRELGSR